MKSIKCIICCCAVLSLLVAGCGKSGQDATTESKPEVSKTADVAAATTEQDYTFTRTGEGGRDDFLQFETRDTQIGKLVFENGYPTKETATKIYDAIDYQRACQAFVWAVPVVTLEYMRETYRNNLNAEWGEFINSITWDDLSAALTANATTPYYWAFYNLAETGPMVIDDPAGRGAGYANDMWQRHIVDFGIPGKFKGKGGKHLILGPGQKVPEGAEGYNIVRSPTFCFMSNFRDLETDPEKSKRLIASIKNYPWSKRNDPHPSRITPQDGKWWACNSPRGMKFWRLLSEYINREPIEERDRFFTAMLRPLGIEKGKEFNPDERLKKILTEAAYVGEAMTMTTDFAPRLETMRYVDPATGRLSKSWRKLIVINLDQRGEYHEQLDERTADFYECLTTSQGMTSTTPGIGSNYLTGTKDSEGEWLHGSNHYKLHVPANVPAKNFWSLTVYRIANRCLMHVKEKRSDRSSRHDLIYNEDGSVDLYIGPTAPEGKEKNWIPTDPTESWFCWFRLYGPLQPHFDRSWVLPDFEKVK